MREKNSGALHCSMDILKTELNVLAAFELKDNFTDSTVSNTEETGDIHYGKKPL